MVFILSHQIFSAYPIFFSLTSSASSILQWNTITKSISYFTNFDVFYFVYWGQHGILFQVLSYCMEWKGDPVIKR